jgi:transposase InsO family protein
VNWVWQRTFADFAEARRAIATWNGWYNAVRPHQALGYRSPAGVQAHQAQQVA